MRAAPTQIAVALLSAGLLVLAGMLSQEGWSALSGATLQVSHAILTLYETDVVLDAQHQLLGVGSFRVLITQECSGYEGIGLVVAFLALYCWLMRRELRFPHALVLFPIGIAAVWMLNALRIAALVSIGRHVSPEIAVNGFHSQAGWIGFLAVGIGIMAALASRSIRSRAAAAKPPAGRRTRTSNCCWRFLVPFMALMATSIVASLFAPHGQWLYVLKVAAVGAALWMFAARLRPPPLRRLAGLDRGRHRRGHRLGRDRPARRRAEHRWALGSRRSPFGRPRSGSAAARWAPSSSSP